MDTKGGEPRWGGDGGVMNWATGIDMYTLMCLKLMTNKNLQGTRVRALVWEDPTCRRAMRPVSHNY